MTGCLTQGPSTPLSCYRSTSTECNLYNRIPSEMDFMSQSPSLQTQVILLSEQAIFKISSAIAQTSSQTASSGYGEAIGRQNEGLNPLLREAGLIGASHSAMTTNDRCSDEINVWRHVKYVNHGPLSGAIVSNTEEGHSKTSSTLSAALSPGDSSQTYETSMQTSNANLQAISLMSAMWCTNSSELRRQRCWTIWKVQ